MTGVCQCKPNVIGDKCNLCDTGYYLSDYGTCSPCDCDVGGPIFNTCDMYTGQCTCTNHTKGINCDECVQYYYPQPGVALNSSEYCQRKWHISTRNIKKYKNLLYFMLECLADLLIK